MHKITAATDCGHAANPQQIEAQVEGSFVYGLSAMLYGEMTYKDGDYAIGRVLGRCGRAHNCRRRACCHERDFRGDR